jgi:hypothetical protein
MLSGNAWVVKEPCGRFESKTLTYSEPAPNQIFVRICASGVNPLDRKIRAGRAEHAKQPLPAAEALTLSMTLLEGQRSTPPLRRQGAIQDGTNYDFPQEIWRQHTLGWKRARSGK